MANETNPYLQLSLQQMLQPNPYTQYNQRLPIPGFRGVATDAQGRPIGTTLNSTPAAPAPAAPAAPAPASPGGTINYAGMGSAGAPVQELMNNFQTAQSKLTPQQLYDQQQTRMMSADTMRQQADASSARAGSGFGSSPGGAFNPGSDYSPGMGMMAAAPPPAAAPPAAAPASSGFDPRQDYLDKLANPGQVITQGATVPQSQPLGVPSVMSAFLAAHPGGGGKGAGNYDNSGFFDTLNRLGSA